MKRGLITSAAICAMTFTANAADYSVAPAPVSPIGYDWSGPYVGVGLGWFQSKSRLRVSGVGQTSPKINSFAYGGYLGYNFMLDNGVVLGGNSTGRIDLPGLDVQR